MDANNKQVPQWVRDAIDGQASVESVNGKTLGTAVEKVLKSTVDLGAIKRAKEARFTMSASLLSNRKIDVEVVANSTLPPAAVNLRTHKMLINEAWPKTTSPFDALVFDRGKLYHEVFHVQYTKGKLREKLAKTTHDRARFLAISNILEDGRIERIGRKQFAGTGDYIDALLGEIVKEANPSEIDGLILYVRTKLWRNAKEAAFWKPYEAQIEEALSAKHADKLCKIAYDIVEAAFPPKPPEPEGKKPEPQEEGEGDKGEGEGGQDSQSEEKEPTEAQESEESQSGEEPKGEDESDEGEEGEEGEEAQGESSESESEGEGSDESSVNAGSQSQSEPDEVEAKAKKAIEQIVNAAMKKVAEETLGDLEAIVEEAESYEPTQEYASDEEAAASDEVAETFSSLRVELDRVRFVEGKAGKLNMSKLPAALTTQRCFQTVEDSPSLPHVALLLDVSSSMHHEDRIGKLSVAARVLNGALIRCGISHKVITFGGIGELHEHTTINASKALPCHGCTPTGQAMEAALDWFDAEQVQNGLVVVVTDGAPTDLPSVVEQKERATANGHYAIGILIGCDINSPVGQRFVLTYWSPKTLAEQYDDYDFCPDVETLPAVLQPKLAEYIASL